MSGEEPQEDLRCRFCLAMEVDELIPVFCIASTQKILISHMALACTGLVISCRDKLPQYICDGCLGNLDIAYDCWKRCRQSWGNYKKNPTLDTEDEDYRCRICLKNEVEELISLFCICDSQLMKISDIIQRFSGLNVSDNDKFPQYICDVCLGELNTGFDFRKLTRKSNATLRSNSIENRIVEESRSQTNDSSKTLNNTSLLNEFLIFNDPPEQTSPKAKTPMKSSTEKKAKEVRNQISAITSSTKPAESASPKSNIQNKSQVITQNPKTVPKVPATKERKIYSPSPTLNPGKTIGQTVFKKLPQDPLAIDDKYEAPKSTTLNLQSTTGISKKVTQTDGSSSLKPVAAVLFAPDGQPNLKKASFSNPAEFKMLASRILKKPVDKPSPAPVVPEACATLAASDHKILYKKARFTWSQITAFLCNNCDNVCRAAAIQKTCIKCKLRFDNYLSIKLEHKAAQQGYVEAYCCRDCTFFSVTLESLLAHLMSHSKQFSYRGIVLGSAKITTTKQSIKEAVPPTQSIEPVSNKRRVEEAPVQSSQPVAKKQRPLQQKPESNPKVLGMKFAHKWIRVEPDSNIIPRNRGVLSVDSDSDNDSTSEVRVEEEPAVNSKCITQAVKGTLTVEIDSDNDSELEGPEELKEEEVLDTDMKLQHNPLDIIDTMGAIITERPTDSHPNDATITTNNVTTYRIQNEFVEVSSNEEFIGFEEEQLEAPRLVPLAGRTPDTDFFDTLKNTDEYLMVFLKGFLCCGCLKPFKSLEQLKRHRTRTHSKAQPNVNNPSCEICTTAEDHRMLSSKRIFYYCKFCESLLVEEDFHSHRESNHTTEKQLLSSIPVPEVYDVILSKLCPKLALRKKENVTHSPNPFKSIESETIFKTLKETKEYKLLFMKGELCCGCQEWYSSKEALQAHCDKFHTEEIRPGNTAQCELCHADCRTDSRLIRHRLQRVRKLYYFCKICHEFLVHDAYNYETHQAVAHWQQLKAHVFDTSENVGMLISKVT